MNFNLDQETRRYKYELEGFILSNHLPRRWFEHQDHLAIKAYTSVDYMSVLREYLQKSDIATEVWRSDRRIASLRLLGEYAIDMTMKYANITGQVKWLEIIEARPEDQGDFPIQLDHEEVYYPYGLALIKRGLLERDIKENDRMLIQSNPSHKWLSVLINDNPDELKFTDKPLSEIVDADIKSKRAVFI